MGRYLLLIGFVLAPVVHAAEEYVLPTTWYMTSLDSPSYVVGGEFETVSECSSAAVSQLNATFATENASWTYTIIANEWRFPGSEEEWAIYMQAKDSSGNHRDYGRNLCKQQCPTGGTMDVEAHTCTFAEPPVCQDAPGTSQYFGWYAGMGVDGKPTPGSTPAGAHSYNYCTYVYDGDVDCRVIDSGPPIQSPGQIQPSYLMWCEARYITDGADSNAPESYDPASYPSGSTFTDNNRDKTTTDPAPTETTLQDDANFTVTQTTDTAATTTSSGVEIENGPEGQSVHFRGQDTSSTTTTSTSTVDHATGETEVETTTVNQHDLAPGSGYIIRPETGEFIFTYQDPGSEGGNSVTVTSLYDSSGNLITSTTQIDTWGDGDNYTLDTDGLAQEETNRRILAELMELNSDTSGSIGTDQGMIDGWMAQTGADDIDAAIEEHVEFDSLGPNFLPQLPGGQCQSLTMNVLGNTWTFPSPQGCIWLGQFKEVLAWLFYVITLLYVWSIVNRNPYESKGG